VGKGFPAFRNCTKGMDHETAQEIICIVFVQIPIRQLKNLVDLVMLVGHLVRESLTYCSNANHVGRVCNNFHLLHIRQACKQW
jgi:hypothetical protein